MRLGEFLQGQTGAAGQWNCSTLAADWCVALGHPDFAAAWRGVVDPSLCESVPREAGGLLTLWEQGIGEGLPIASDPHREGDIGVVGAMGMEAGAIFSGRFWVLRAARGLHWISPSQVAVLKAWRP